MDETGIFEYGNTRFTVILKVVSFSSSFIVQVEKKLCNTYIMTQ